MALQLILRILRNGQTVVVPIGEPHTISKEFKKAILGSNSDVAEIQLWDSRQGVVRKKRFKDSVSQDGGKTEASEPQGVIPPAVSSPETEAAAAGGEPVEAAAEPVIEAAVEPVTEAAAEDGGPTLGAAPKKAKR